MDAEKQGLIVAAIEELADGGALDKKPNVKEIEEIIGLDITAAERDAAWEQFNAGSDEPAADEPSANDDSGHPVVTNTGQYALIVCRVRIEPGESKPAKDLDADKPVIKAWIAAGLISVG